MKSLFGNAFLRRPDGAYSQGMMTQETTSLTTTISVQFHHPRPAHPEIPDRLQYNGRVPHLRVRGIVHVNRAFFGRPVASLKEYPIIQTHVRVKPNVLSLLKSVSVDSYNGLLHHSSQWKGLGPFL
jgi:hypothetical protein